MVDFVSSMNWSSSKMNGDPKWNILKDLYHRNIENIESPKAPIIPKIFHQIWLGSEYPEKYLVLLETFKTIHPDWEFKIWTDKDVEAWDFPTKKLFQRVKNLGTKSDILRYEILYQQGGVYIDTDFVCAKSFNELCHLDFFAGTGHMSDPLFFNGLLGSVPGNIILKTAIENLLRLEDISEQNYDQILKFTGPEFISKTFFTLVQPENNYAILPTTYFYPFPATLRHVVRSQYSDSIKKMISTYTKPETLCVHLWYTSWQK